MLIYRGEADYLTILRTRPFNHTQNVKISNLIFAYKNNAHPISAWVTGYQSEKLRLTQHLNNFRDDTQRSQSLLKDAFVDNVVVDPLGKVLSGEHETKGLEIHGLVSALRVLLRQSLLHGLHHLAHVTLLIYQEN